jgi:hypothetical protein
MEMMDLSKINIKVEFLINSILKYKNKKAKEKKEHVMLQ